MRCSHHFRRLIRPHPDYDIPVVMMLRRELEGNGHPDPAQLLDDHEEEAIAAGFGEYGVRGVTAAARLKLEGEYRTMAQAKASLDKLVAEEIERENAELAEPDNDLVPLFEEGLFVGQQDFDRLTFADDVLARLRELRKEELADVYIACTRPRDDHSRVSGLLCHHARDIKRRAPGHECVGLRLKTSILPARRYRAGGPCGAS